MKGDAARAHQLIALLRDASARVDERDDAAIDLGEFDGVDVQEALHQVGSDPTEDPMVVSSCGESLATIWLRIDQFHPAALLSLTPEARREAEALIRAQRPDWLS
jgi:hypothetical protein